jgi:hypothetical protein
VIHFVIATFVVARGAVTGSRSARRRAEQVSAEAAIRRASDGLEPSTPSLPWRAVTWRSKAPRRSRALTHARFAPHVCGDHAVRLLHDQRADLTSSPADHGDWRGGHPNLVEALAIWALFGLMLLAIVATYARVPAAELYNVTETGLKGGLGRALVSVNFPVALVAVPLGLLAALRIGERWSFALALLASLLCWVVAVPGVVDQDDLDAKPVNVVPALGVALALTLTVVAFTRSGLGSRERRLRGDPLRLLAGIVIVLLGLPWIFADLGAYIGHVPVLEELFLSEELRPRPDDPNHRVVHLGQHHGGHGIYLALTALVLTRVLPQLHGRVRPFLGFYLSLMLVYGLAIAAEDFWTEQVRARDWTSSRVPNVLEPRPTLAWTGVIALALLTTLVVLRERAEKRPAC